LQAPAHGATLDEEGTPLMTAKSQVEDKLDLWQRYVGIARQVGNPKIRAAYEGLARQALRHAAKLDPAAVTRAARSQERNSRKAAG
jgi:hypothetical protein